MIFVDKNLDILKYIRSKAHAFVDGNTRSAFVTIVNFLNLNGLYFVSEPAEGIVFMEDLASGEF